MTTPKTRLPSLTLLKVEEALRQREVEGVLRYEQTVDRTDFDAEQWARETLNEALDGALYAMRTLKAIERLETRDSVMHEALRQIAEMDPASETEMRLTAKTALRLLEQMEVV